MENPQPLRRPIILEPNGPDNREALVHALVEAARDILIRRQQQAERPEQPKADPKHDAERARQ